MGKRAEKIVLISSPSPQLDEPAMNPPLGLCYIVSYLRMQGFSDITLIDYALDNKYDFYGEREYLSRIPLNADVYGIAALTPQYRWLVDITKYIKQFNPEAMVVSGGAHSSNIPEDCLQAGVDAAVVGDGEIPFAMLCLGFSPVLIPGVVTETSHTSRELLMNLDQLPLPDRGLTDFSKYKRMLWHEAERGESTDMEKAVHIVTMRGCPFNCAFCDRFSVGRRVRYRSVENVMVEVDQIRSEYGLNAFVIYDDTFTVNRKRVFKFCEEFARRGSKWRTWARVNTIDQEMIQAMKDSGCVKLLFGFESGDDRILKIINKKTTRKQNIAAANICRKVGMHCYGSLVYGLPGETRESIGNTVSMMKEAQPDETHFHCLSPLPGSPIWNNPEVYGIKLDKEKIKASFYGAISMTDSASGLGHIAYEHDQMDEVEFRENFKYFVVEITKAVSGALYQRIELDKLEEDKL